MEIIITILKAFWAFYLICPGTFEITGMIILGIASRQKKKAITKVMLSLINEGYTIETLYGVEVE